MTVTASDIETLAQLTQFPIPPRYREAVAEQLSALLVQAELVLSMPLEATLEPAPVFSP
jgi:hypothetical protein